MRYLWPAALLVCVGAIAAPTYLTFFAEVRDVETAGAKPTIITEFSEGIPVRQVFTFPRSDLRAFTFLIWSERPLELEIELELRREDDGQTEVVDTVMRRVPQPAGEAWHTFAVKPVANAEHDQILAATIRLRNVIGEPATTSTRRTFGLMAFADDALASGRLYVGEQPRWGDLAFFAQAEPATRFRRMPGALAGVFPAAVRPGASGLLLLFTTYACLLLATVAVGVFTAPHPRSPLHSAPRSQRWGGAVTSVLLVVATVATAVGAVAARERVAVDLFRSVDNATLESPQGVGAFGLTGEEIAGVHLPAIFAHPPARMTWHVAVPDGESALRTAVALQGAAWQLWWRRSDGVEFRVLLQDGERTTLAASKFVDPGQRFQDRAWLPVAVDLSDYAGRTIAVTLETAPGPSGNAAYDWALWAHPRIVISR